ncbi:MAG TPA: LysE family transporter [Spirochaetota bacterium]|nr:LysE family transporter [Spirochaetota bacterium]
MILINIFLSSFIIAFSGALVPGPLLSYTITKSLEKGWKAGPMIIIGHAILEILILIVLILGLSPFLNNNLVIGIISIIGMIILLFIALDMILTVIKKKIDFNQTKSLLSNNLIISGILMSISNPFWFIWWVTIGINYITLSIKYKFLGIGVFFVGHILADFLWYSIVSFSIYKSKKFINLRLYKIIMLLCAILIIVFSLWFGYNGILYLIR